MVLSSSRERCSCVGSFRWWTLQSGENNRSSKWTYSLSFIGWTQQRPPWEGAVVQVCGFMFAPGCTSAGVEGTGNWREEMAGGGPQGATGGHAQGHAWSCRVMAFQGREDPAPVRIFTGTGVRGTWKIFATTVTTALLTKVHPGAHMHPSNSLQSGCRWRGWPWM